MPAFVIMGFFILLFAIGAAYFFHRGDDPLSWILVIPAAAMGATYFLRDAINEHYYKRFPRRLDRDERGLLLRFFPFYSALEESRRIDFEHRLSTIRVDKTIKMQGTAVPGDVALLLNATLTQVTFGLANFSLPALGVIILYPKTFISPALNEQEHAGELNRDDYHTIILAINAFVDALKEPHAFYNVAIHCFAEVLIEERATTWATFIAQEPALTDWSEAKAAEQLLALRNFKADYLKTYTALDSVPVLAVAIEHYYSIPDRMLRELPALYDALSRYLGYAPPLPPVAELPATKEVASEELPEPSI